MTCVHQPTGGAAAVLLWDDEAKPDGERIGIAVCVRCGAVFAALFVEREIGTPSEGALRYVGPFTGSPREGGDVTGLQWFGMHWGAPICDQAERVEAPLGSACVACDVPIEIGSTGLLIPHIAEVVTREPWHLDCFLKSIGASPKAGDS